MAVNPRVLGASGLVVAGVLAAAVVGQLPAFGVTDHAVVATPSSARQQLVCPGPVIAIGADGGKASALSAEGSPTRTTGTSSGAKVTSKAIGRGDVGGAGSGPRALTAKAADDGAGAIAGAQTETVTSGDAVGLASTACTVPVSDAWFAAGSTTTGRTTVLTLANPSTVDADVQVRLWTENGPVDTAAGSEVSVPARSRKAISLASLAPLSGGTVVRITTTGARVGAALEQRTVRGLESGGVDLTGSTAAPAMTQVISGMRISGAAATAATQHEDGYADLQPVVRVLLPGSVAADVKIVVTGAKGQGGRTVGRHVAPGVVTDFPITGLADGVYSARIESSRPLVAGARVSVVGDASASATPQDVATGTATDTSATDTSATDTSATDTDGSTTGGTSTGSDGDLLSGSGPVDTSSTSDASTAATSTDAPTSTARGIDLAWIPAGLPLDGTAAVAVTRGPSPMLTLSAPGTAAVRVVVTARAGTTTVSVPANGTVSVPVSPGIVTVKAPGAVRAAVSYAGPAAIAAYPVLPADQAARAVRVTH